MVQDLSKLTETPSQTAGPYVHIGCVPNFAGVNGIYDIVPGETPFPDDVPGDRITVRGAIFDGVGMALRDVLIESWQAGHDGAFGPGTHGFGRMAADAETGEWELRTVRPGANQGQAPHIALWIVARGINIGLQTRIYFPEDNHDSDPVLSRIEHRSRVKTLIARPDGKGLYRFDVHLQGDQETVFLDI